MITAVVLTKNEEKNISACLDSLKWCDEILVIDDGSTDNTLVLAENAGARILKHALDGDFASQRNLGLEKAEGDWVLFVDADERVSLSLSYEILHLINETMDGSVGYVIKRRDVLWGKELQYGETGTIKLLRLAKKNAGEWKGKVHERWMVKGKIGELRHPIMHYPHQTISEFLKEINYYTTLRAEELHKKKVKTNAFMIILYPKAKFLKNYIYYRGFLDGIPGLISAVLMSFHSFLVRGKLWQLSHK